MNARTAGVAHRQRRGPALEVLVPCVNLTADGEPCGKPGVRGLPAGVCAEHAAKVFRACVALWGMLDGVPLDDA